MMTFQRFSLVFSLVCLVVPAQAHNKKDTNLSQVTLDRLSRVERRIVTLEKQAFHGNPVVNKLNSDIQNSNNGNLLGGQESKPEGPTSSYQTAADMVARIQYLEASLQQATGKAEELEHKVRLLDQRLQSFATDTDARMKFLESPVGHGVKDAPQKSLPKPPCSPGLSVKAPSIPAPKYTPEKPCANDAAATKPANQPDPDKTVKEQYEKARALLYKGQYGEAAKQFEAFMKEYPQSSYTPNAQYWLAETHFVRGDFKKAAATFAQGYEKFPHTPKAPDFLLKLGMSLGALGQNGDACTTYMKLRRTFPNATSNITAAANREVKKLKCQK